MAEVKDGTLVIYEGDKYEMRGDTLVFIESVGEEDGTDSKTNEVL